MTNSTQHPTSKPIMKLDFEKAHTTYLNAKGEELPGVTTVLDILGKPALIYWAWNQGKKGLDYRKVSSKAADVGTVAHALSEAYLKGMELDTSNLPADVLDTAETSYIQFVQWWDQQGLDVMFTERALISEKWQCGGTMDIMARRRSNGNIVVIDLKTSKAIYREMRIQLSAYAAMSEEMGGPKVDERIIARIGKESKGDFEAQTVYDWANCVDAFDKIAAAYHALKAVK
jgi:hypothetical protein